MKSTSVKMKNLFNEGHDIETAEQMVPAIGPQGGVARGTSKAVWPTK